MKIGTLRKLKAEKKDIIQYSLPLGDELIPLNELIGKKITLEYTGNIYCVDTNKKIKKSDETPKYQRLWNGEQYVNVEIKK